MNWLQVALALFQLAPSILQLIAQAETLIQGAKVGAARKDLVMSVLPAGTPTPVLAGVSTFVDGSVSVLNKAGALVPKS